MSSLTAIETPNATLDNNLRDTSASRRINRSIRKDMNAYSETMQADRQRYLEATLNEGLRSDEDGTNDFDRGSLVFLILRNRRHDKYQSYHPFKSLMPSHMQLDAYARIYL